MLRITFVLLVSLVGGSVSNSALASCRCLQGRPVDESLHHEAVALVFKGRLVSKKAVKVDGLENIEMDFQVDDLRDVFLGGETYLARLIRNVTVVMPAEGKDCRDESFRVGDHFTVFTQERSQIGKLYTDRCWGNRRVSSDGTSPDLDYLRDWKSRNSAPDPQPDLPQQSELEETFEEFPPLD